MGPRGRTRRVPEAAPGAPPPGSGAPPAPGSHFGDGPGDRLN